jgi:hypothetical protein
MIPVQYRALAAGLGLLLAMALAGAAGWFTNGWRHDAEIAELQRARGNHAQPVRAGADHAAGRRRAHHRGGHRVRRHSIHPGAAHVGAHQGAAQCTETS